jgi:hypothetical protein
MVKMLMIMHHITLFISCITFLLMCYTYIFVIDPGSKNSMSYKSQHRPRRLAPRKSKVSPGASKQCTCLLF